MNRTESLRNWLIILALLLVTGVVTAVWPLFNISLNFGGPSRPATEQPVVTLPIPTFLAGALGSEIDVNVGLLLAVTAVVIVSVAVVGVIVTAMVVGLNRSATAMAGSKTYQENVANLNKREQEKIKQAREAGIPPHAPGKHIYHLDPFSLSLIILLFVIAVGTLFYVIVFPEGSFTLFGITFASAWPIILILFAITIPLLFWRVRRHRLEAVLQKDNAPIPWDFFAVLITGLIVVGVGLGVVLFIN